MADLENSLAVLQALTAQKIAGTGNVQSSQAPFEMKQSALPNMGDRFLYGFADDMGKRLILRKYYQENQIVPLPNGEYGVRIQFGNGEAIKPVDPKGFQANDMINDFSESIGKGITVAGGTVGGVATGYNPIGAALGSTAGELARQGIGGLLGVRNPENFSKIAYQGADNRGHIGGITEAVGEGLMAFVAQGASNKLFGGTFWKPKEIIQKEIAKQAGKSLPDNYFQNMPVDDLINNLDPAQQKALENMPIDQIHSMKFGVDPKMSQQAAQIEQHTGIKNDITEELMKYSASGKDIPINAQTFSQAETHIARSVDDAISQVKTMRNFLGTQYQSYKNNLMDEVIDISDVQQELKDIVKSNPKAKGLLGDLGLGKLLNQKKPITIKQFLALKDKMGGTATMQAYYQNMNEEFFRREPADIIKSKIDGIIRAKIRTNDTMREANTLFGEGVDITNALETVLSGYRAPSKLEKIATATAATIRNVIEPLQKFDSLVLKYGKKSGAEPIYDKLMIPIIQKQYGRLSGKYDVGVAEKLLYMIPGVGGKIKEYQKAMNNPIVLQQFIKTKWGLTPGSAIQNTIQDKAMRIITSNQAKSGMSMSLNKLLYRGTIGDKVQ